ncbi:ABC transporter permease [Acinetobacter nectaris]|uniref:ABC transporter permease n=1 Tax=Acinetobacter nectaris TaxID=1219382 RepID=UPI001F33F687|nr:ABC transporter permease [Acinetobacter nectaris]MCF9034036.1 ABC transporter permease [Acinetobacter nectaris]MCF9047253.1 ABC transporter permease [Acinetobacter nectaris]
MSTHLTTPSPTHKVAKAEKPHSLWSLAWRRLKKDKTAMVSLTIVLGYLLMILLSMSGFIAQGWNKEVAVTYAPPSFIYHTETNPSHSPQISTDSSIEQTTHVDMYGIQDPLAKPMQNITQTVLLHPTENAAALKQSLPFGADRWGVDIIAKTIKGSETSILVGLIAAFFSVVLGTVLGAISGYFNGWVDDFINWFYNVFTSIPYMLLILAVAAVLQQQGIISIILILALTGWTSTYRLIRAEYMKHVKREYVLAAKAIGVSHIRRMFIHIFPNVSHIALVQMSILVVSFIKSEVILSFLGFGVPLGTVSWGSMLNEAQSEFLIGKWWQLAAATIAMAILVTAFSTFTDALRDALDPKMK